MKTLDFEQGSIEWFEARKGIPTASRFSDIVTAKTGAPSASSIKYAAELLVERLGFETPHFTTEAMEHGIVTEKTARDWFEFQYDVDVTQVGMVTTDDGRIACSPDGLICVGGSPTYGWECKCPLPKTHMLYLMEQKLPDQYKQQVHGSMWVCDLDAWHFMSYVEGLEPFSILVERDDYTEKLGKAITQFAEELDQLAQLHA